MADLDETHALKWAIGALTTAGLVVWNFLHGRIDKKLSKDVFEEFKEANTLEHGTLRSDMRRLEGKIDKLINRR